MNTSNNNTDTLLADRREDSLFMVNILEEMMDLYIIHRVQVANQQTILCSIYQELELICLRNKGSSEAFILMD